MWTLQITGGRNWDDKETMKEVLRQYQSMAHELGHRVRIVHGDARGADKMSEKVAHELGIHRIGVYPAKWDEHGKAAGPIRNRQMLDEEDPDLVVAFHDRIENSKGTKDMMFEANKRGISVHLYS